MTYVSGRFKTPPKDIEEDSERLISTLTFLYLNYISLAGTFLSTISQSFTVYECSILPICDEISLYWYKNKTFRFHIMKFVIFITRLNFIVSELYKAQLVSSQQIYAGTERGNWQKFMVDDKSRC